MQVVAVNAAVSTSKGVLAAAVADPFANTILWTDGRSTWLRTGGRDTLALPDAGSRLVDWT
jgi:nicotinamide riboside kinase